MWTSKAVAASESGSAIENVVFRVCVCVIHNLTFIPHSLPVISFYSTFFSCSFKVTSKTLQHRLNESQVKLTKRHGHEEQQ